MSVKLSVRAKVAGPGRSRKCSADIVLPGKNIRVNGARSRPTSPPSTSSAVRQQWTHANGRGERSPNYIGPRTRKTWPTLRRSPRGTFFRTGVGDELRELEVVSP